MSPESLRPLTNENIPARTVAALRALGHDVASGSDRPGDPDEDVLARASREGRLLVTRDKGFGELAFRRREPAPHGIILVRARSPLTEDITQALVSAIDRPLAWAGHLAVIEPHRVRMTPLPPADPDRDGGSHQ